MSNWIKTSHRSNLSTSNRPYLYSFEHQFAFSIAMIKSISFGPSLSIIFSILLLLLESMILCFLHLTRLLLSLSLTSSTPTILMFFQEQNCFLLTSLTEQQHDLSNQHVPDFSESKFKHFLKMMIWFSSILTQSYPNQHRYTWTKLKLPVSHISQDQLVSKYLIKYSLRHSCSLHINKPTFFPSIFSRCTNLRKFLF